MKRLGVLALAVVVFAVPVASSHASGATYEVVHCGSLNRTMGGVVSETNAFTARNNCSDEANDFAFQIDSVGRATQGRAASVSWGVEPPLGIVGVSSDARLRRGDGYQSRLFMADADGLLTNVVAVGSSAPSDFSRYEWDGPPQRQFVASLECFEAPNCPASPHARTWVRDQKFTVADYADPEVVAEGTLYGGGWLRGPVDVILTSRDEGSGVSAVDVQVNSTSLKRQDNACTGSILGSHQASLMKPCPNDGSLLATPQTAIAPFRDGVNEVRSCGFDFAGNESCVRHTVDVDNESPELAFTSLQDPKDPELIRVLVNEEHSGVASAQISFRAVGSLTWRPLVTQRLTGELQARVDSAAESPGAYEFRVEATDVAGNFSETTFRENGTPMTLDFPLRSGVDLNAQLKPGGSRRTEVNYGKKARIEGRLVDAAGESLSGQEITVDEYFGEGALIDHRVRTVVTDESGRWSSLLPAGPSRSVSAVFNGDQRYLSDEVRAGRLAVRTGASLGLSRKRVPEGKSTVFHGRIGRLGARIPQRGKLIQLQYQDPVSGRWFTVRNPFHTRSDGRFRFNYEFGTHYAVDVSIRFRLKVPPESDWPYRPVRTKARRVIVQAR